MATVNDNPRYCTHGDLCRHTVYMPQLRPKCDHCYCQSITIGMLAHLKCCNCGHTKQYVITPWPNMATNTTTTPHNPYLTVTGSAHILAYVPF